MKALTSNENLFQIYHLKRCKCKCFSLSLKNSLMGRFSEQQLRIAHFSRKHCVSISCHMQMGAYIASRRSYTHLASICPAIANRERPDALRYICEAMHYHLIHPMCNKTQRCMRLIHFSCERFALASIGGAARFMIFCVCGKLFWRTFGGSIYTVHI